MTTAAKTGLLKRAEGMTVKREAVDPQGGTVELEEELPPDVSACKAILTIVGDMREKHEVSGESLADFLLDISKKRKNEVK